MIGANDDTNLIREAELKASGSDIHEVKSVICLYSNSGCLLRKNLSDKAKEDMLAMRTRYERILKLYVRGHSIKEAKSFVDSNIKK